jgi:hypothetical protein
MSDKPEQVVTIGGKQFNFADLSDKAKTQLANIRVTDREIERLEQQLSIFKTARNAYTNALLAELPDTETT